MIDHLSPREIDELEAAAASGDALPAVIRAFADGTRLRLGWDHAIGESALARAAGLAGDPLDALLRRASRWCATHGLHLMSFAGAGPGEEPIGDRRWFMAVG